ncbi:cell division protein ZapE [Pseudoclavibacter chungangensis]|uniref:AFG1/ZapE family ATPase n=1 Tax=Pseudoclavibacter chungangensis TaxID=587635 RepID=UPI0015CD4B1F|nr:AFG1/ZapE family ATPase [Pseudoclavibacter chungangensis]NYJ67505.1 cell division protein ZapE [Pseudoclavibacter chungangensis]
MRSPSAEREDARDRRSRRAVTARAADEGFVLDAGQVELLDRIAALAAGDTGGRTGLYVSGPAGRGKSWLARTATEALPVPAERVRRVHFHDFFEELRQRLGPRVSARDAIDGTVTSLLDGAEWFFFDELHVHDPAGAALLTRLLRGLAERRIPTLVTSNYAPEGLLPSPVYHHLMEPGIAVIRESMIVTTLDGGVDYRARELPDAAQRSAGFASGRWIVALDDDAIRAAGLEPPTPDEAVDVTSGSYRFTASAVRDREVWFSAGALLEARTTPQDYLRWIERFDRGVLHGLPPLSGLSRQAQQRFVSLLDVLVDRDVPLTVLSSVARHAFVDRERVPPDVVRARSRLSLLETRP